MKIALIGATGFVGAAVLAELLQRGHSVGALARNPAKLAAQDKLTVIKADVLDSEQVATAVAGYDAVISAYNPGWTNPNIHDEFLQGSEAILAGLRMVGVKRVLVVGGAGSLYLPDGSQLVDSPDFPAEWKPGALAARELLNRIRKDTVLDWTFLSPPVHLEPGAHEGPYRVSEETPIMAGNAPGRITVADLAVAIVDEIETPKFVQKRFTVGY
ncbi:MAG: NAD(P)H-binding protein [Rhodocyclaceae bacterium]|nr:NAD(P)H-binding protein [Rhodocyclaceae bacterium]